MPESLKILGQVTPGANSDSSIYLVPTTAQAVCSSVVVANTTAAAATFRLHATTGTFTSAPTNALFYDVPLAARSSAVLQLGLTLAPGQRLIVQSSAANTLTFTAFGQEIS